MVVVGAFWPSPGTVTSDNFADPRFQLLSLPSPYYNDFIDTIWNYNIPASSASADMKKLFRQT